MTKTKLVALTLALCPLLGQAQNESKGKAFTLDECIAIAIKNNPEYQSQVIRHTETKLQEDMRKSAFLPTVHASLGNSWDLGRSVDKTGVMQDRSSQSLSISIGANLNIFSGFSRLHELRSAQLQRSASERSLEQARLNLGMQVTQLYFSYLTAERAVVSAQKQYQRSTDRLRYAEGMCAGGKWGQDKLANAEANLAQMALALTQAEGARDEARLSLVQALGLQDVNIEQISIPESIKLSNKEVLTSQSQVQEAILDRPDIKANSLRAEALQEQIKAQRSGYMPSLSLSLGYSNNYYKVFGLGADVFNLPISEQFKQNGRSYIGLNLSIPIFDAFQTRNRIRMSKLSYSLLQVERNNIEVRLRKELETIRLNMSLNERNIEATRASLKATEKAFALTEASWRAGRATSNELSDANLKVYQTELDLYTAEARYLLQVYLLRYFLKHE